MRRIISTTLVAVSLVAVTGVGALAQTEPEQAITPAGLNADKIDGRHAVGHGASVRKRAGKLVATNKRGQLPSNIVKPSWRLMVGKPAAFADGKIGWGEVQNKPAAFRDGKIGWGEVQNKPPGFADGVDDGITGMKVTRVEGPEIEVLNGLPDITTAFCPAASKVTGGGFFADNYLYAHAYYSNPRQDMSGWEIGITNTRPSGTVKARAYAICMTTNPSAGLTIAKKRR